MKILSMLLISFGWLVTSALLLFIGGSSPVSTTTISFGLVMTALVAVVGIRVSLSSE